MWARGTVCKLVQLHASLRTVCRLMQLYAGFCNCMQAVCKLMQLYASLCNCMQASACILVYWAACKLVYPTQACENCAHAHGAVASHLSSWNIHTSFDSSTVTDSHQDLFVVGLRIYSQEVNHKITDLDEFLSPPTLYTSSRAGQGPQGQVGRNSGEAQEYSLLPSSLCCFVTKVRYWRECLVWELCTRDIIGI